MNITLINIFCALPLIYLYAMQGLTEEQVEELHLVDEWAQRCVPSGGAVLRKDDVGRRCGQGKS